MSSYITFGIRGSHPTLSWSLVMPPLSPAHRLVQNHPWPKRKKTYTALSMQVGTHCQLNFVKVMGLKSSILV